MYFIIIIIFLYIFIIIIALSFKLKEVTITLQEGRLKKLLVYWCKRKHDALHMPNPTTSHITYLITWKHRIFSLNIFASLFTLCKTLYANA